MQIYYAMQDSAKLCHYWWNALAAAGLLFLSVAIATPAPTAENIFNSLGIPQIKIAQLEQGAIITHEIHETTERELAMSLAIYVEKPLQKVVDFLKNVDLPTIDPDVTAHGLIPKNALVNDFKGFGFSSKQMDEVLNLISADAGESFNLSSEEITHFISLKLASTNFDKKVMIETVSQKYRELLFQRWQAYRKSGLKGMAPYLRDEGVINPADELHFSAENCKLLEQYFPDLFQDLENYPISLPSGSEEHFFWINRNVEDRPTAILGHTVVQITESSAVVFDRQFYVGHSYNTSQMIVGALPYRLGTLVFYAERTSTDLVAGITSTIRHTIGREQLKKQMINRIEWMGKFLETASTFN